MIRTRKWSRPPPERATVIERGREAMVAHMGNHRRGSVNGSEPGGRQRDDVAAGNRLQGHSADASLSLHRAAAERLPVYLRALAGLDRAHCSIVTSAELSVLAGVSPDLVRKDLNMFGRLGVPGAGYPVSGLAGVLRRVLALDRSWNAALVGVGRVGRAVLTYPGFEQGGFSIVAAFDADPGLIGAHVAGITIQPVGQLRETVRSRGVRVGIVAVPAPLAQETSDLLVEAGIHAILSYAPAAVQVPPGVELRTVEPILMLQSMVHHLA